MPPQRVFSGDVDASSGTARATMLRHSSFCSTSLGSPACVVRCMCVCLIAGPICIRVQTFTMHTDWHPPDHTHATHARTQVSLTGRTSASWSFGCASEFDGGNEDQGLHLATPVDMCTCCLSQRKVFPCRHSLHHSVARVRCVWLCVRAREAEQEESDATSSTHTITRHTHTRSYSALPRTRPWNSL